MIIASIEPRSHAVVPSTTSARKKAARTILAMLLGLGASAALGERDALASTPLVYGQWYNLQNGYAGWQGGFLDTRGSGCQGDDLCVSTATTSTRDGGSGSWMILSATGQAAGTDVLGGDVVYLQNMGGGNGGYLDTDGNGCEGDDLCVATSLSSSRDGGSGSWMILPVSGVTGAVVNEEDTVRLENGWGGFGNGLGGYLDTRGSGCQSNDLCVATSGTPDRDSGSTWWALTSPTTVESSYSTVYSVSDSTRTAGYDFGISFSAAFDASMSHALDGSLDQLSASASLDVPVTLFSSTVDMFSVNGSASVTNSAGQASYEIDVLGGVVKSGSANLPYSGTLATYKTTFFSVEADYMLGPIPVTVSADATGTVEIVAVIAPSVGSSVGLSYTLTPAAEVDGDCSAGFGGSFASAGIEGDIAVLAVSLPITAQASLGANQMNIDANGSLELFSLSGDVKIYAEVADVSWDTEIFSWTGPSYKQSLFNSSTTWTY